jgi:hypothetical protein
MSDDVEGRVAAHGKRMIEVRIRFWTNDIATPPAPGKIIPKHGWDAGVVDVQRNTSHGIEPQNPIPFNGMAELPSKIEKLLLAHGITLHLSRRASRYLRSDIYSQ